MNKLFKKFFSIFILIVISTYSLSGCTYNKTIDELAYVIAIGLDVGENNNLQLSFQISTPSSNKEGSSTQSTDSVINTVDCESLNSGISIFNSYLSKEVNLSHCKVVVISEELAGKGISELLYTLNNHLELRSDSNVIISKTTAKEFLNSSNPIVEKLSAKYFDSLTTSSEYTGYIDNITLGEFFSDYTDSFQECYAILGGIRSDNEKSSTTTSFYSTISSNTDINYIAGEVPIESDSKIENMGIAVFSGDKLVGELNGMECICHMLITSSLNKCIIRMPSPINTNEYLDFNIRLSHNSKNTVTLINGTPFIETNISVNVRLLSMTENSNVMKVDNKKLIEDYLNQYLEEHILEYLYKTSKEFNSDIDGFGKHAVKYFKTWDEWTDYNWLYNYRNAFFKVTVNSNLRSGYLFMDT